jgi:hypothetical protein
MIKSDFDETPDGIITAFTLSSTPATGGLVLVVHNGQILKVVASGPGTGECTVSGTAVVVGLAPTSSDDFWAYIQDNIQTTIRRTELTGDIDGTNRQYTVKSLESGTNLLVLFNGLAQKEVTTAGANQFSIASGSAGTDTVTLGIAPLRADEVWAYLPVPTDIATETLTFTGAQDDANKAYALTKSGQIAGLVPRLIVTLNGQAIYKRDAIAANTDWIIDGTGDNVTLGLAPASADNLEFYALGAEFESWDELIARTQQLIDDENGHFWSEEQLRKFLEQAQLFIAMFRALGEETDSLTLTSGQAVYVIHDTWSDFIMPLRTTISNKSLRRTTIAQLQAIDTGFYGTSGTPEMYYMVGGNLMGFYPVPTSGTAVITRLKVPDGAVDKYDAPTVDRTWARILPLYAAGIALILEGKVTERTQSLMQRFMEAVGLPRDRRFMGEAVQKAAAEQKIADQRRSAESG